jgi:hypothetical protein
MSQQLVRACLVAIVVMFGSSVAFAQEKTIPKSERGTVEGAWAEDCANPTSKWFYLIASWVEIYPGGKMITNKEGKRVFNHTGKRLYRSRFSDVQSSGPGVVAIKTKANGTLNLKMLPDGKMNVQLNDTSYQFSGDLMLCK